MVGLNAFIHLIQTIFDFAYITLDTGTLQPVKNFKYSIEKVSFLEIFVIFFHFHQLHFQFEEARLWSRIFLELYSEEFNDQNSDSDFLTITTLVISDSHFEIRN